MASASLQIRSFYFWEDDSSKDDFLLSLQLTQLWTITASRVDLLVDLVDVKIWNGSTGDFSITASFRSSTMTPSPRSLTTPITGDTKS